MRIGRFAWWDVRPTCCCANRRPVVFRVVSGDGGDGSWDLVDGDESSVGDADFVDECFDGCFAFDGAAFLCDDLSNAVWYRLMAVSLVVIWGRRLRPVGLAVRCRGGWRRG